VKGIIWIIFLICICSVIHGLNPQKTEVANDLPYEKFVPFRSPVRIAYSSDGLVYVTDFQKKYVAVMKIQYNMLRVIRIIPVNGNPLGLAVHPKGYILVGNNSTNRVEAYSMTGEFKLVLEGEIKRPNDIAISSKGFIYIVASDENMVKVYDLKGNYRGSFGSPGSEEGQFNFPTGITVDDINKRILVSDFLNKRVQIFDYRGNWLKTIGGGWFSSVVDRPQGIAIDKVGRIYVVDSKQACVLRFDESGKFLDIFGEYGHKDGQLRIPLDIAIDGNDNILVTSNQNARVEMFTGGAK
jgi:DNA-binding beta-propeller fold protein YncE